MKFLRPFTVQYRTVLKRHVLLTPHTEGLKTTSYHHVQGDSWTQWQCASQSEAKASDYNLAKNTKFLARSILSSFINFSPLMTNDEELEPRHQGEAVFGHLFSGGLQK